MDISMFLAVCGVLVSALRYAYLTVGGLCNLSVANIFPDGSGGCMKWAGSIGGACDIGVSVLVLPSVLISNFLFMYLVDSIYEAD